MIRPQDLRIDVYRSGGITLSAGDPGVAVRITHLPSGLAATGRHERSGFIARDKALAELEERLADRYCMRHYDPDAYINIGCELRWGRCHECVQEDRQAWLDKVRSRLAFGLMRAAEQENPPWDPSIDTRESILTRMMELKNVPATFEDTVAWVRKYLGEKQ